MIDLIPFGEGPEVQADAILSDKSIIVTFSVSTQWSFQPSAAPKRKVGLWEKTCFECFIRPQGGQSYLEINFAPNGDWNAFYFTQYRSELNPYQAITKIEGKGRDTDFGMKWSFEIPRHSLPEEFKGTLEYKPTMVWGKGEAYYAPFHPGKGPDFHHEKGYYILKTP